MQGPPDQLLCDPADNGGFLVSGVCELPDSVIGLPYQGHLVTSHKAGGALSVVSGSLPPGLSLPATFTGSGDTIGGTATDPGVQPGRTFTVQGTGDQGQPLYQAYSIRKGLPAPGHQRQRRAAPRPGTVGQSFAPGFFLSGGAAPCTWSWLGTLPPRSRRVDVPRPAGRQRLTRRYADPAGPTRSPTWLADPLHRPAGNPAIHPRHRSLTITHLTRSSLAVGARMPVSSVARAQVPARAARS